MNQTSCLVTGELRVRCDSELGLVEHLIGDARPQLRPQDHLTEDQVPAPVIRLVPSRAPGSPGNRSARASSTETLGQNTSVLLLAA